MPPPRLTAKQARRMREDRARGATLTELAARYRLSYVCTWRCVTGESYRYAGGPIEPPQRILDGEHHPEVVQRRAAGEKCASIALDLGLHESTVAGIWRRHQTRELREETADG